MKAAEFNFSGVSIIVSTYSSSKILDVVFIGGALTLSKDIFYTFQALVGAIYFVLILCFCC